MTFLGRRRGVALLLAAVLVSLPIVTVLPGSPAGAAACGASGNYRVTPGARYALPGTYAFESAVIGHIQNARSGAYIRVATWAFTSTRLADALIKAHRDCDVEVQVLLPKKADWKSSAVESLIAALGRGAAGEKTFVKVTTHSARGADVFDGVGTTMHQKSWQFSSTGASRRVTIITSANATANARDAQATDNYTWVSTAANDAAERLYDKVRDTFATQVRDKVDPNPYMEKSVGNVRLFFSPWNSPGMADPVIKRINGLPNTDLTIRIAMAAWNGARGQRIANAIAAKVKAARAAGHQVGVFALIGRPRGEAILATLRSVGAEICDGHAGKSSYLHSKFMTAKWRSGDGKAAFATWAGSENWGDDARGVDELVFKVPGVETYLDYVNYFNAATDRFDPTCSYR